MSLFNLFKSMPPALLIVRVNGSDLCAIYEDDLPCEKTPSVHIDGNSTVSFVDCSGTVHDHVLASAKGWAHISIRVHASKACQADCVVSDSPTFDANACAWQGDGYSLPTIFSVRSICIQHGAGRKGSLQTRLALQRQYYPGQHIAIVRMRSMSS